MVLTTKSIVLSSVKFGDSDLIVTCFTEESGVKSYLLHKVLGARKSKIKPSYFQALNQLELEVIHKDKGTLERIIGVKMGFPYASIPLNMIKGSLVIFIAEILKMCIREEEPNKKLFRYLEETLRWLDQNEKFGNFPILFLVNLSSYLGFYPNTENLNKEYFNLVGGNFQESATNNYCEKGPSIQNLKLFFGINFDDLWGIKLTRADRSDILNLLLLYYNLHLHNFKTPKSLQVLKQLFEQP